MKKALAILSALALVAGAAFADGPLSFTVGTTVDAWGSQGFQWVGNTTDAYKTDNNFLGVNYSTEKAGVTVDARFEGGDSKALVIHNYSAWIKPVSSVKVSLGTNVAVSVLGAETIRWNTLGARSGEVKGAVVELTPVDGVYIGAVAAALDSKTTSDTINDNLKAGEYGAGASYAIPSIGTVGAQYRYKGQDQSVNGGFKLTAVQGLEATASYTAFIYNAANTDPLHKGDVFVTYSAGPLTVKAYDRLYARGKKGDVTPANAIGDVVKAEVNYKVSDVVSFNTKAFYKMNVKDYDAWDGGFDENTDTKSSGFRLWASLPIAFDKGVTVTPGFQIEKDLTSSVNPTWSIPVAFVFNF